MVPRMMMLVALLSLVMTASAAAQSVIVLTAEQAAAVRGPSAEAPTRAALAPIALTDGRFILGVEVLDDPNHAEHRALLQGLARTDYSSIDALIATP